MQFLLLTGKPNLTSAEEESSIGFQNSKRDQAIEHIQQFMDVAAGRRDWKRSSGYHSRSLVKATMMRFKRTFTDKLRSRRMDTQQTEVYVKCSILNKRVAVGILSTILIRISMLVLLRNIY